LAKRSFVQKRDLGQKNYTKKKSERCAKRKNSNLAVHDETRIGCKAMVYLKKKDGWIISRFIKDHNHVLFSPRSSKFL